MRAQLQSHLLDINRTADLGYRAEKPNEAIDLVVVTDSEAILGIGGGSLSDEAMSPRLIADQDISQTKELEGSLFRRQSLRYTPSELESTLIESCRWYWMLERITMRCSVISCIWVTRGPE